MKTQSQECHQHASSSHGCLLRAAEGACTNLSQLRIVDTQCLHDCKKSEWAWLLRRQLAAIVAQTNQAHAGSTQSSAGASKLIPQPATRVEFRQKPPSPTTNPHNTTTVRHMASPENPTPPSFKRSCAPLCFKASSRRPQSCRTPRSHLPANPKF